MPRSSVIYGSGTAWYETQSLSGNLDLKTVLFHSKNHFRCTQTHTRAHNCYIQGWFFFFLLRFYYVGRWGLCFTTLRLSAHFYPSRHEQWCEKPNKQACSRALPWQRQRRRCLGVSSQSIPNGGLSVSMGILGHTNAGEFIFEAWRSTEHMDSIKTPPPPLILAGCHSGCNCAPRKAITESFFQVINYNEFICYELWAPPPPFFQMPCSFLCCFILFSSHMFGRWAACWGLQQFSMTVLCNYRFW